MNALRKDQFTQKNWRINEAGYLSLSRKDNAGSKETIGTFFSSAGAVEVWMIEWKENHSALTVLLTVDGGRMVRRSWQRAWSRRTLRGLCRKFLEDLAA